ncbi:MAG: hypothetical protein AB1696_20615 [Planctomycetota bacterium]
MNELTRNASERSQRAESGIALVEVMVSALVLVVALFGLMSAITSTVVVDAVTQENNLALHAARQVMEQVKSEGFTALEGKINYSIPQFSDSSTAQTTGTGDPEGGTEGGTDGTGGDTYYIEGGDNFMYYDPFSTYGSYYTQNPTNDWYGNPLPEGDARYNQDSIVIDQFGNFEVADPVIGSLEAWDPAWVGGQQPPVGAVRVSYARDANGNTMTDVLDITILVRWRGQKGNSQKMLRCQMGSWEVH